MSSHRNSPNGDEQMDAHDDAGQSMAIHPVSYSGMPMHMYPFPPGMIPASSPVRAKRRQVKNACTNCQKACKKCDEARPCRRCVKYGVDEECVNSQRKERQKGVKRGPYKKRDSKGNPEGQGEAAIQPQAAPNGTGAAMPQFMPFPFPPGYPLPQFPQGKPGEGQPQYVPYYIPVPMPAPPGNGQEGGEGQATYPPPGYYPYPQFAHAYPPYMMPHPRPDGQMVMPGPYYAPMYAPGQKPPSSGGSAEQSASSGTKQGEGSQNAEK